MSKHTPGPWRIGKNSSEVIADMPATPPFRGMTEDRVKHYGGYLVAESCAEADAHLIAAAPELLEALQNLENDDGKIPAHAWELVQAAIAKATEAP